MRYDLTTPLADEPIHFRTILDANNHRIAWNSANEGACRAALAGFVKILPKAFRRMALDHKIELTQARVCVEMDGVSWN